MSESHIKEAAGFMDTIRETAETGIEGATRALEGGVTAARATDPVFLEVARGLSNDHRLRTAVGTGTLGALAGTLAVAGRREDETTGAYLLRKLRAAAVGGAVGGTAGFVGNTERQDYEGPVLRDAVDVRALDLALTPQIKSSSACCIKEAAGFMDQAKGAISGGADKIKEVAGSADLQKLLPYLLAGGAGAVTGGALSGKRKARAGETRGQYLTRVLRNAVVAGGLVGGGSYLAHEGFKKTLGSVDLDKPLTGGPGDEGPVGSLAKDKLFSPWTAAAAGGIGLGATAKLPLIGANPNEAAAGKQLVDNFAAQEANAAGTGMQVTDVGKIKASINTDPIAFQEALRNGKGTIDPTNARLARVAGLNTHLPGSLEHRTTQLGKIPSLLMGRSGSRRALRGGVGLASALVPALLGSLLTNKSE